MKVATAITPTLNFKVRPGVPHGLFRGYDIWDLAGFVDREVAHARMRESFMSGRLSQK